MGIIKPSFPLLISCFLSALLLFFSHGGVFESSIDAPPSSTTSAFVPPSDSKRGPGFQRSP
ncbi:hypothetical protein ES319_A01G009400v1 [Gossypium barbadense]|uniref:Uncharacterized protein n=1 Tax=Gossypium barbadense TaxID=3634 RepID=A0A5J5WTJ8_GOSBA|nr:hypothetical protein ES319_A01G009400v1 [Gossypium barbadense]